MSRVQLPKDQKYVLAKILQSKPAAIIAKYWGWEKLVSLLIGLLIWQIVAGFGIIETPCALGRKFIALMTKGDPLFNLTLVQMIGTSLSTLLAGSGLAFALAIPLGILLGHFRRIKPFFELYISLCRPIPPMAWIPIGYILFARMPQPTLWVQVMVVFLGAFFPCFTIVAHAVQSSDPILVEAAKTIGVKSQRQLLIKIVLPSVVPAVISGIRSGLGVGWMCIIGAEFVGGRMGIGAYIWSVYNIGGRISEIMIAILFVGFIGVFMNEGIIFIGRRIARWYSW